MSEVKGMVMKTQWYTVVNKGTVELGVHKCGRNGTNRNELSRISV